MKVAVITDDGKTVSEHFGRALSYVVFTVDGQKIVERNTLDRGDIVLPPDEEHEARHGVTGDVDCHGVGAAAAARHRQMIQPIEDCEALLARGMSWSARECLLEAGVRPILTNIVDVEEAVQAYLAGSLENHVELLH